MPNMSISLSKLYRNWFIIFLIWYWFINPDNGNISLDKKLFWSTAPMAGFPVIWWLDTIRKLGTGSLALIPVMANVFFVSKRGASFFFILGLCTIFWWSPYAETRSSFAIEMTIIMYSSFFLLWLQPPGVLFLANANHDSGDALLKVSSLAFPLRTISMLDKKKLGKKFNMIPFILLTDDCTIESEYEWRTQVDKISKKIEHIILDARRPSESLSDEVILIAEANDGRIERTICIVNDDGSAPVIEILPLSHYNLFNKVTLKELSNVFPLSQINKT